MHYIPDAVRTKMLTTDELRAGFLVQGLFVEGTISLRHIDLDRVVIGGAVPLDAPLELHAPDSMAASYFAERREIGILNIGATGSVAVDGASSDMESRDVLYVGRGSRRITFASADPARPARFYVVSYPAHATHPTTHVRAASVNATDLGASDQANRRRLAKFIHGGGPASAQLVMGVTELQPGSVWNTMPSHTHIRRTEVYLYFGLPADAAVVHLMGEPDETRHLIVRNGEAVLSPPWSIHSGCGTTSYSFCWAMGGENQDFTDMQSVDMRTLK
ncbi:MAG: 5-dehydro-4-deoxy-D-glucuronate isomerase [Gemmatimonadaceae bacterium]